MLTGPLSILAAALAALGVFIALGLEPSQDADHPPRPEPLSAGVMEDAGGRVVGDLSLKGIGDAVDRIISYAVAVDAAKKAQEAQEVARLEAVAVAEHAAEHEREAATQVVADVARESAPVAPATGSGCVLPGDICQRESGGSYTARNAGSGACGMYQVLGSTWAGYGGYGSACDAPPSVQDAFAAQLWDGGAGCGHWSAC